MPNRVHWNSGYSMGNETLDRQHQNILAQCNAMADCLVSEDPHADQKFNDILTALLEQAREHFITEEALLIQCNYPTIDEHQNERDEFDYLTSDIIIAENFEAVELQRSLALWWVGHIVGSGKNYRDCLGSFRSPNN
jgi:hemerythrin-like metal-binding protein